MARFKAGDSTNGQCIFLNPNRALVIAGSTVDLHIRVYSMRDDFDSWFSEHRQLLSDSVITLETFR